MQGCIAIRPCIGELLIKGVQDDGSNRFILSRRNEHSEKYVSMA